MTDRVNVLEERMEIQEFNEEDTHWTFYRMMPDMQQQET